MAQALRHRDCEVHSSDLRLRVRSTGLYTYPDVVVICGEPAFADDQKDALLNPTVTIEVLSDSTRNYDRGQKFRTVESIKDYLTVSQTAAHLEHYAWQFDGRWILADVKA